MPAWWPGARGNGDERGGYGEDRCEALAREGRWGEVLPHGMLTTNVCGATTTPEVDRGGGNRARRTRRRSSGHGKESNGAADLRPPA